MTSNEEKSTIKLRARDGLTSIFKPFEIVNVFATTAVVGISISTIAFGFGIKLVTPSGGVMVASFNELSASDIETEESATSPEKLMRNDDLDNFQ